MKAASALLCLLGVAPAAALELRDWQGLAVTLERMPGTTMVDGLAMEISRAEGTGVAQLAERVVARWQAEGSPVRTHHGQGWLIASRLDRGRSETIQWRGGGGSSAQLLHSMLAMEQLPHRPSAAPFALPDGCAWGRVIEGGVPAAFEQRTAHCRVSAATLASLLQSRLKGGGWRIDANGGSTWELQRAGAEARLTLVDEPAGGSSLVWLSVDGASR